MCVCRRGFWVPKKRPSPQSGHALEEGTRGYSHRRRKRRRKGNRGRPGLGLGTASPWAGPGQVLGASEAGGRREGYTRPAPPPLLHPLFSPRTGGTEQFGQEAVPEGACLGAQSPPHLQRPQVEAHVLLRSCRVCGPLRGPGVARVIGVPAKGEARLSSMQRLAGLRRMGNGDEDTADVSPS